MNYQRCLFLFCLLYSVFCILPGPAHALGGYDEYFSVTPQSMGEAYGAAYGDIASIFWNPAGIGAVDRFQFTSLYTDLYGLDYITQTNLGFVVPWGKTVHGLSYATNQISFDFSSAGLFAELGRLEYKETTMVYSVARSFLIRNFYLGANLKYYDITSNLTAGGGQGSGYGVDVGALFRLTQKLAIGLSLKNITGNVDWKTGLTEDLLLIYRLGLQYEFSDKGRLLVDVAGDDEESLQHGILGGEMWVWKSYRLDEGATGTSPRDRYFKYLQTRRAPTLYGLALRSGIKRDFSASTLTFSTGAGLRFGPLKFDYALRHEPDGGGNTSFASLAFELGGPKSTAPAYSQFFSPSAAAPTDMEAMSYEQKLSISDVPTSSRVAVANFVNLTGRSDFAWLELGIADMVYNELLQRWDMIDRVEVAQKIGNQQVTTNSGGQWAKILGANKVIFGFFSDLPDGRLRIDTYVFDTKTGKTRQTTVEKSPEEIYSIGTELAYKVFFL
ncbi:MAG: hypothetical protein A3G34_03435 [Candidatus Lindowbacteria bacterium RIFCSPLOWO2_12_FULL_62_27]|nr:MAG: hypothetical protein A3I06_06980 [Candidatus Lindowbacteria bacterium RIFCSPLOWO2_02_FULL_62_12]OGH62997.1 MAG: hypothetical protein A3G34_03435 [Candidatus Lindowbacteria bacterium RIFCSPLOWO2_12_FULL_62_27]